LASFYYERVNSGIEGTAKINFRNAANSYCQTHLTPEKTKNIKKIKDHGGEKKQTAYGVRLKENRKCKRLLRKRKTSSSVDSR